MKWLKYILVGILVSFYYFPITFTFLPFVNTKNAMGVVGLVCLLFVLVKKREFSIPKELFILLLLSGFVSIVALFSITYNQTPDITYVTYFRSACIWLSGAFAVCCVIWLVHGKISIPLITNYLAGVCVFQCVAALAIRFIPPVGALVDATVAQGQYLLKEMGRMYGIGASLDVGGSRFSAALIAIAVAIENNKQVSTRLLYVLAFSIITVIGNIIARTTLVGVALGLGYIGAAEIWHYFTFGRGSSDPDRKKSSLGIWFAVLVFLVPLGFVIYQQSLEFQEMMRFGFEGFFSLAETGEWNVTSNTALQSMIVWPEELRTWIIGDGYFANQIYDENYIGDATTSGYYMGTDIGYLRYIFYFGIIGLIAISSVMIYACHIGIKGFPEYRTMILLALLAGFIVWLKVSTDLFPFYALVVGATFLHQDLEILSPEEEDSTPESVVP